MIAVGLFTLANLLPNASFELGFGEAMLPTHWADYQNRLTLRLTATGQVPPPWPSSLEQQEGAPDGRHVVRIVVAPGAPGHLPSPVVPIKAAQAYTISLYARSDEPSAKIRLTMWTRPLDFRTQPDTFSRDIALSDKWHRYVFHGMTEDLMEEAVVDVVAMADKACNVWVDAVQLEEGSVATPFQSRLPVEAVVYGRRSPLALHFMNEPLVIYFTTHNGTGKNIDGPLEMRIETLFGGKHLMTKQIAGPIEPGVHEHQVTITPTPVGRFRARLFDAKGRDIGADEYPFLVHPVMPVKADDYQAVMYSVDGTPGQVPAERIILDWTNKENWYADPPQNWV